MTKEDKDTHTHVHMHTHTYITYTCIHTHTHTHTHIHTHTHTHTQPLYTLFLNVDCVFAVSIMTFCLIVILVLSEIEYYSSTELQFDYEVDTNFSRYTWQCIAPLMDFTSTGLV